MTIAPLLLVRGGWIRRDGKKPRSYHYVYPGRKRCVGSGASIDCKFLQISSDPLNSPCTNAMPERETIGTVKPSPWKKPGVYFMVWEVTELGCVSQYIQERYTEPYNEIAEYLSQYGQVEMSSLPKDFQFPAGCRQWDATDLAFRANEILPALASMGLEFFYKFITQETSLDRRNLILANGRNFLWVLPDICPSPEDGLPLLYPADRFNFGEDFDGLKRLLATLSLNRNGPIFSATGTCSVFLICQTLLKRCLM